MSYERSSVVLGLAALALETREQAADEFFPNPFHVHLCTQLFGCTHDIHCHREHLVVLLRHLVLDLT